MRLGRFEFTIATVAHSNRYEKIVVELLFNFQTLTVWKCVLLPCRRENGF